METFTPYEEHEIGRVRSCCNYCPQTYAFDTGGNGSSITNMLRHINKQCKNYKAKLAGENQKQMCLVKVKKTQMSTFKDESGSGSGSESNIGLGCFNKDETRKALAKMLIVDELPFRFVEKPGFQEFCRTGMLFFDIPSRRTIVRDIMQLYLDEKTYLIKMFRKSKVRVCLTTDTWTLIQNINYMVVIAHYIDDYWQLQKRILSFSQIVNHRGETIEKCIEKVLIDWGINKVFTITMDNASSNNTTILYIKIKLNSWKADGAILDGKYLHLRCCAHIVNLIVNDGLKEMNNSVAAIRNAVKLVKSSPSRFDKFKKCFEHEKIQDKGLVVLDVYTRWNSTYLMLVSALKFNYFKETENGKNRIWPPHSEHWENAKIFVQFLKTFYDVTMLFNASLSVTLNLYFHKWGTINNQLMKMSSEGNSLVRHMASTMKIKFEKYWGNLETTNNMLIIAIVLDPRFKLQYVYYCFKILYGVISTELMTASIKDVLVELYDCYHILYGGTDKVDGIPSFTDVGDVQCDDEFGGSKFDLQDGFSETVEMQDIIGGKNEVERFLLEPWSVSKKHYPILACIANDVLAMPIFTIASESAFSNGGRDLDPFRSSLNPKMVECLICTENWLQAKRSTIAIEVARALMQNDDTSLENLQFNEEAESGK
ncbi:hypothetical protein ACOSQ4_022279 [Xanthoceras sorbifolium]